MLLQELRKSAQSARMLSIKTKSSLTSTIITLNKLEYRGIVRSKTNKHGYTEYYIA